MPNDTGPYQLPPADAAPASARKRGLPPTARFQPPSEPRRESATPEEPAVATGERMKRTRKRTEDKFYIPAAIIPPGWTYEWKAQTILGKSNLDHMNNLKDNHWKPVPADRHPRYLVEKDGQILMERPKYLTDEARREDLNLALEQVQSVRTGVASGPQGTAPRKGVNIRTGYDDALVEHDEEIR